MWDVFKDWIFDCIAFFANFLGDWGLAIIVITVIFRLLVFMLWISWSSPAGVLLFWGASSVIGILQQQLTMRHLKRVEAQAEAARIEVEPVKVDVERKAKKKRPTKKH